MSQSERSSGGNHAAIITLLMFLLLPVMYVLSIGPAAMYYQNREDPEWAIYFYMPLAWLANSVPICDQVLGWYIGLWTT